MKISIIIPVFRVEKTLPRCIESVLGQDFDDWEMILVDDGSDDNAPQICDHYAASDQRILVIHQVNAGLGAARNTGIEASRGDYLMFVDSDDFLANDTLSPLVKYMDTHSDIDFTEFAYTRHKTDGSCEKYTFDQNIYDNPIKYFFNEKVYLHSYAWNKIYRRLVFETVRFVEGKKFEDMYTLPQILQACHKVATIDIGGYEYIDNPCGITAQARHSYEDLLEAHFGMMNSIDWHSPQGVGKRQFAAYYASMLNVQICVYCDIGNKAPLMPRQFHPYSIKLILTALLGIKATCQIFKLFYKVCKTNQ